MPAAPSRCPRCLRLALFATVLAAIACGEETSPVGRAEQPATALEKLAVTGARITLPLGERGHWPPLPTQARLTVHVSLDAVYVAGQRVLTLDQGRFPPDALSDEYVLEDRGGQHGRYVPELAAALQQAAMPLRDAPPEVAPRTAERRARDAPEPRCFELASADHPSIAMVPFIDAEVPYETLLHLVTTGLVAGVDFHGPVATMPSGSHAQAPWRPQQIALYPLPMACTAPQYFVPPHAPPLVLHLSPERVVIDVPGSTHPPTILDRADHPYTLWREVYNAIQLRDDERPLAPRTLELSASPETPLADVLRAADAAALHRAPRNAPDPRKGMQLDDGSLGDAGIVVEELRLPHAGGYVRVPAELRSAAIPLRHVDADYASSW